MPDEVMNYSSMSNLTSSRTSYDMDGCISQDTSMLSTVRANKQRMINTIKRKRGEGDEDNVEEVERSTVNHYGYENESIYPCSNTLTEQTKKARIHPSFQLQGIQHMGHPASVHYRDEMMDTDMDECRTSDSKLYQNEMENNPSKFNNFHHQCIQPEQYLQLAVSTPTGHPHPYSISQSSSRSQSAPSLIEAQQSRQEIGAGYFDRVKY